MNDRWLEMGRKALRGETVSRDEALAVLHCEDEDILSLMQAAWMVRRHYFGRRVNLHILCNAKSGMCGEDCAFCSQSVVSTASIPRYPMKEADEIVKEGREAARLGAAKYCIVTSGRRPSGHDLDVLAGVLRRMKAEYPRMQLCVSVGLLEEAEAQFLKQAGADRINHNLETSRRFFPNICTTHTYDDRVRTIQNAKRAGLEICSGGLIGMGESDEDRVELAMALRKLGVHSIPVNFLTPREGTPLADRPRLRALDCLKTLAMFRLTNADIDIRAAGGREANLGALQSLALFAATSIFTEGYLTTPGQGYARDMALIRDAGFEVGALEA